MRFPSFINKSKFVKVFLLFFFLAVQFSAKAQCYENFYVYQLYPYGQLCYPQNVTLRAEYFDNGTFAYGEFRWYTSEFDPNPVYTGYIDASFNQLTSDYSFYANNGTVMWVSFYNYSSQCESYRTPYGFTFSQAANVYQVYANQCRNEPAKVQVNSDVPGVTFQLYKYYEYYDPWFGLTQGYMLEQSNTTGYFEIDFFDPNDAYNYYVKVYQPYGCSMPYYYQLIFDITTAGPPTITGNLSVAAGSTATLYASGTASNYNWYSGSTLVNQGWAYTTPVLDVGTYTYTVQGVNFTGTCSTDIASVTITVDLPNVIYTSPHSGQIFTTRTIDVSKPVGKINGSAANTASGGSSYTIPIYSVPGTKGVEPSISLAYNSQSGNGIAGFGWNITGLSSITRTGKDIYHDGVAKPINFSKEDPLVLDGKRLNPFITIAPEGYVTQYVCEEEAFGRVFPFYGGSPDKPIYFDVYTKEGILMEYGKTVDSKLMSDDGNHVLIWRINRIKDLHGNYIDFVYDNSFRDSRIKTIKYTGNQSGLAPYNSINFYYKNRTDKNTTFEKGATLVTKVLLDKITVVNEGATVKSYQLNYGYNNFVSLLKDIVESGSDGTDLNSTAFLYGEQPQDMTLLTSSYFQGEVGAGDFNGDGKTDIVATDYYYDNGIRFNSGYRVYTDPTSLSQLYAKTLPAGHTVVENKKMANFLAGDFNHDGRDDILMVKTAMITFPSGAVGRQLEKYIIVQSTNTGNVEYQYPTGGYKNIHPNGNFLFPGDFDGDGSQDFITILGVATPSGGQSYAGIFTSPSTYQFNKQITNFLLPGYSWVADVAEADRISPIDFDGDRKMELLITKGTTSYVMSIDNISAGNYHATVICTTGEIASGTRIFPGDFNADGKTDILARNSNGTWKILYSTGVAFSSAAFVFNQNVNMTGSYSDDKIVVADFNGDGISDIVHGYNFFQNGVASTSRLSFYYGRGHGNAFVYNQLVYNKVLPYVDLVVGDFNGDGRSDLMAKGYYFSSPADIIQIKPNGTEHLLAKVADGHNLITSFNYKLLTDKSTFPYVYNRTVSLDDPANGGGINYVQIPLHVVSSISSPNGVGGTSTTTFTYEDAVVHKRGKGFLGFKKVYSNNLTAEQTDIAEYNVNLQFGILYPIKQAKYLTPTAQPISENLITTAFDDLSTSTYNKRYFQKVTKSISVNHLTGVASEATSIYDVHGNVTTSVTKDGSYSTGTVTPIETTTINTVYGTFGSLFPDKATSITATKQRTGSSSISSTTQFSYNSQGRVTSKTEFAGMPKAVTTTYTYNSFGNMIAESLTATGLAARTTNFTYDAKGRFVLSKQVAAGTAVAQTETFTVDSKWGKPLTVTSNDCITSSLEYDAFGRLIKTTYPFNIINVSYHWDIQGLGLFYMFTDYAGGKPDSKVWYDVLGRGIKEQHAGFNNQWSTTLMTYNTKRQLVTQTTPHFVNETPIVTSNTYDAYGRLLTTYNATSTVSKSYSLAGGTYTVTTTDNTGQTNSRVTDASGKLVSSSDKGGNLFFSYDSRGLQTEVKHGTTTVIINTYDPYGRQLTHTDINAGTTTFDHDAFGQLRQKIQSNGATYLMAYDELSRIISTQGPEGTTQYEYFKDNVTGCSNNNLKKMIGGNGVVKEFVFDNLRRVQSEITTVDGIPHTITYNYDAYSNVSKTIYPSGVEVNNTYDNHGNLTSVTGGSAGAQTTLFTAHQQNAYGQYTSYTLANGKTSQMAYENGLPKRFYAPGVQDLNFTFDFAKGNLLSRYDAIKNHIENFQYDALNRLTQTSVDGVVQLNMSFDGNSTFSMGNIASKTDAGNYVYRNDKIHAVAHITNPTGTTAPPISHSTNEQVITYTPFLKTASINEANVQLNFTYDPDFERIKTQLLTNGVLTETRIYLDSYEKQTVGGVTREIHYVQGGNGVCAFIVKENGVNNFYVTYTDYQGSILTLTNLSGAVVAEQNFDAWGRKRNPTTWAYGSAPHVPTWLYRGYTGHEHLPEFALINMNGRMYDPIMGRMISPDIYIPDALNTQSYNRYTYANNNPLVFTDPDGNLPVLPIIIGAVIGAYAGGTIANQGQLNPFKWDWNSGKTWEYVIGGAIIGAASGALGAHVASSSMPFANTAGIVSSSFTNSVGMNILTGGQVPISVNFGIGSYNFESGELNFLGKKGNSFLTNLGYAFGALANIQDAVAGLNGTSGTFRAEGDNGTPHARFKGSWTDANGDVHEFDISINHVDGEYGYKYINDPASPNYNPAPNNFVDALDYGFYWFKHRAPGEYFSGSSPTPKLTPPIKLYNVNGKKLAQMFENMDAGKSLSGKHSLIYGGLKYGCHGTVARALWRVGVPTLPINLFPAMLWGQLAIRQVGIAASPYIHFLKK